MTQQEAYNQYLRSKVMTASPGELTLMLYDGAIRFCNQAIKACEEGNVEEAHNKIRKVQDIIVEFQSTLNYKYEVANDFNNIYVYLKQRLSEANIKKDVEILNEVNKHLHSVRDTWKKVMEQNKISLAKAN